MMKLHNKSLLLNAIILSAIGLTSLEANAVEKETHASAAITKKNDEILIKDDSPQAANLKIEAVTEMLAPTAEAMNGKISFDENYTSRVSSPVLGRATKLHVQIGDKVSIGQTLMTVDSPDLGSAIADYRKATADLDLKRKAFERSKMLLDGGVIAHKDFESSEADMAQAQAEATRAKGKLRNLSVDNNMSGSESFTLKAPMSGVIVDRQINVGNEVRPDAPNPLFIITNPQHLWATIDLPERDLGKVNIGQLISIQVDAYPTETFTGKILSIGTMIDPVSRRVQVRCSIDSKDKLKPEMYARITPLNNHNQRVIRLPTSALITEGLYSYVFVETSPGHLKKRRISLDIQEHEYVTVKSGLVAGDKVVTIGAILLNSELASK
jgi:cobalt-zinc-cadmium efflux system membrane fusion protein